MEHPSTAALEVAAGFVFASRHSLPHFKFVHDNKISGASLADVQAELTRLGIKYELQGTALHLILN